jgi:hypothetical protein
MPIGSDINLSETMAIRDIVHHTPISPHATVVRIFSDSANSLKGIDTFINTPWSYLYDYRYDIYHDLVTTVLAKNIRLTVSKVKAHLDDKRASHTNPMHTLADTVAKESLDADKCDTVMTDCDIPTGTFPTRARLLTITVEGDSN